MAPVGFERLDGFWTQQFAWYLSEHKKPLTRATHMVGIPILVVSSIWAIVALDALVFVVGWILGWGFQIIGHRVEGNRPALLKNPIATLLGPLMVLIELGELCGLRFEIASKAKAAVFGSASQASSG